MTDLRKDIETAINRNSAENGSDTPDFVLAGYLTDCLAAFDSAVRRREEWYKPTEHQSPPILHPDPGAPEFGGWRGLFRRGGSRV